MTNQLFKNGVLPFVVDAYDQSVYDSKIVFSTQDIGTAKLVFQLRKDGVPLPLSAVDGKLVLSFNTGSKNVRNITLVDKVEGIAEYVLDNDEIKQYGKVQASLNLYYRNGQALSVHEFTFEIQRNLIDKDIVPAAEFYIDDFQTLKTEIERMAAELETDIQKRTKDMQGNIDKITKELQEQLDHLKEKLGDLEALETKQGAQDKVDAALAAAKKYTEDYAETPAGALKMAKDLVVGFQQKKITTDTGMPLISIKDTSVSILDAVINNGLGQGTFYAIAGSKDLPNHRSFRGFFHMTDVSSDGKATFGWVYATDYINNIYTNYLNNNVWSGWSRISNHNMLSEDGKSQLLPNGTDILTLPSGYYYAVGTNVVNLPSKTDSSWFNIYVIDNSNNRKTFHVIRSADNLHWWGTTHTDGSFKGWERMLTEKDLTSSWNQVTFVTGTTKHFPSNPLQFSIRLNSLHLRGSFEGVPANDTIIARFTQKPSSETVFGGTTVGSYGAARLTLGVDGSLKFNGLNANDNTKVTRIELNEEIPLW
ncbi:BppU family phage baseplate upper protein [Bacillus safensis]|uniref:BppU family phage baseplate upper protein n=1 Tax=Bacillus safensis TaxID=561879 RepID=UPI001560798A|nr:BppU family phage baseplate upper protein [Bacillus safensis]NRF05553.1 BppU family phage baseplate upper protein [Bacillus safensis]